MTRPDPNNIIVLLFEIEWVALKPKKQKKWKILVWKFDPAILEKMLSLVTKIISGYPLLCFALLWTALLLPPYNHKFWSAILLHTHAVVKISVHPQIKFAFKDYLFFALVFWKIESKKEKEKEKENEEKTHRFCRRKKYPVSTLFNCCLIQLCKQFRLSVIK